jgi:hypothetical protein
MKSPQPPAVSGQPLPLVFDEQQTQRIREEVLYGLRARLERFGLKPGTKRAAALEADFIAGAMVALQAIAPHEDPSKVSALVSPIWVFSIMSGRSLAADAPLVREHA